MTEAIYLRARDLVRSYGLNELREDPRLLALQRWVEVNKQCVFWLEQLALLPAAWHLVLAWIFYVFLVKGRSPSVLERRIRRQVWWMVLLAVAAVAAVEAACFYCEYAVAQVLLREMSKRREDAFSLLRHISLNLIHRHPHTCTHMRRLPCTWW